MCSADHEDRTRHIDSVFIAPLIRLVTAVLVDNLCLPCRLPIESQAFRPRRCYRFRTGQVFSFRCNTHVCPRDRAGADSGRRAMVRVARCPGKQRKVDCSEHLHRFGTIRVPCSIRLVEA